MYKKLIWTIGWVAVTVGTEDISASAATILSIIVSIRPLQVRKIYGCVAKKKVLSTPLMQQGTHFSRLFGFHFNTTHSNA